LETFLGALGVDVSEGNNGHSLVTVKGMGHRRCHWVQEGGQGGRGGRQASRADEVMGMREGGRGGRGKEAEGVSFPPGTDLIDGQTDGANGLPF